MQSFSAIIPVRELERGVFGKKKDYLPFADSNLLTHKLRQLKQIPGLDIVVSTESEILSSLAKEEGVRVIKRPKSFSGSNVPFSEFVKYICGELDSDHVIWACVTSPLVTSELYKKAIRLYMESIEKGFDSLISVQKLQRYLMDKNGALNFKPGKKFKSMSELTPLYIFTNGISISPREKMIEWGYTSGELPYMLELSKEESIDICDSFDYECAKYFWSKRNSLEATSNEKDCN